MIEFVRESFAAEERQAEEESFSIANEASCSAEFPEGCVFIEE